MKLSWKFFDSHIFELAQTVFSQFHSLKRDESLSQTSTLPIYFWSLSRPLGPSVEMGAARDEGTIWTECVKALHLPVERSRCRWLTKCIGYTSCACLWAIFPIFISIRSLNYLISFIFFLTCFFFPFRILLLFCGGRRDTDLHEIEERAYFYLIYRFEIAGTSTSASTLHVPQSTTAFRNCGRRWGQHWSKLSTVFAVVHTCIILCLRGQLGRARRLSPLHLQLIMSCTRPCWFRWSRYRPISNGTQLRNCLVVSINIAEELWKRNWD